MYRSLLASLLVAATAVAQQITLPEHTYFQQGSTTTTLWRSTAMRFQVVYDTVHFAEQGVNGPILISRLRFRAANGAVHAGGVTYSNVVVQISSCPLNYASASTTFANNRGADNQVCFSGPVTTLPATGTTPNDYFIDISLTTPFLYDPTIGLDLAIEVDSAAPVGGTVPVVATGAQRCRRVTSASQTSATGTGNAAAACILMDFGGTGGWSTWSPATAVAQGEGCYRATSSYYEFFADMAAFDLANTTITMVPNGSGGYTVLRGPATAFRPHGATHLGLTDDDISVQNLPAGFVGGFPFPGGSTSVISICSNGFVYLANDPIADLPDAGSFLFATGRLAPLWYDLVPDATNNVYYDIDPNGQVIYVTWDALPGFVGGNASIQLVMYNSGLVEYRLGAVTGAPLDFGLVGWTPGNGASDPGSIDLSAVSTLSTVGPDSVPLTLESAPPFAGATMLSTVSEIPLAALATVRVIASTSLPGIDLGVVGAPGCPLYLDPNTALDFQLATTTPLADFTVAVPNNVALFGLVVHAQAAALHPAANAFGMITSNAVVLTIGNG